MLLFHPLSKVLPGVSAVDPDLAQACEPARDLFQDFLSTVSLGATGRGDNNTEQQPEDVHEDMPLAALDLLAGIIANHTAVPVRLDALAVEDRRTGFGVPALLLPKADSEGVVERGPSMIEGPLAVDTKHCLPGRKVRRHQSPRDPAFEDVEDGVHDQSSISRRASALTSFGQHGLEEVPLCVRKVGVVFGVFHRPNSGFAE